MVVHPNSIKMCTDGGVLKQHIITPNNPITFCSTYIHTLPPAMEGLRKRPWPQNAGCCWAEVDG